MPRPERNDPCLCGSGRKYKKCCLERVQKSTETIRRAAGAPAAARFPRVVELLGLACGIRSGPPEIVPDPEKAGRAVAAFYQNMAGAPDGAALERYLEELGQRLGSLLRQNSVLQFLRFPLSRVEEHFAERGEPGARDGEALLDEAERGLFTPEFAFDAAIALANALCLGEGSAADLETLAGGLGLLVEEGDVDFIGGLVLVVTLEEVKDFDEELAKITGGKNDTAGENDNPAIAELCERYPAIERELSRRYVQEIRPVLDKIASGEIPVSIPFYAVVNGFLALDRVARPAISAAAPGKVERLAEALVGVAESFLTPGSPLEEAIFVRDYYFFASEAIKSLQSWLAKNEDSSLRAGVERLLGGFWDTRFSAGR
ncbi:MAG: SEC-C domain-containing protein, partial [Moorella sp. (in: Bacteria)]|nr:SEC-C domain-containing protein [Moorella sp. (in: firmicutes)]